ncbi:MAG: NUDIX domain-containing protein [Anaerolineales bacterium]|nr:NUDIX domain-containing protein [Anaerolineales bacterium]
MYYRLLYLAYRIFCFLFRPVRMGVRVMMIQDQCVTLVRQTYLRGWFMPGGGLKRGETLEQAARREAREETGAELGALTLMGAYTNFADWRTDHNLVFVCRDFKIIGTPDQEIAELKTFPLDQLPADLWPGHSRRIEEYRQQKNSPQFGEW